MAGFSRWTIGGLVRGALGAAGVVLVLAAPAAAADLTFPDDCATFPDCMAQICAVGGGTLHVAPGRHRPGPATLDIDLRCLGGPIRSTTYNNVVAALCGDVTVRGAGMDATTLDLGGSLTPNTGAPAVNFGARGPCDPTRYANITLSDMTIECGASCSFAGVGVFGTDGATVERVRVTGFGQGIHVRTSTSVTIADSVLVGAGAPSTGIALPGGLDNAPTTAFGDPAHNVVTGLSIHGNRISGFVVGIAATAIVGALMDGNTIDGGRRGVFLAAGRNVELVGNRVRGQSRTALGGGAPAGFSLRSVAISELKENVVCELTGAPALIFGASSPAGEISRNPTLFLNGNRDVEVKENRFLGYSPDHCENNDAPGIASEGSCFAAPNTSTGGVSDGGGNEIKLNVADPAAGCD
jgi:hypothetical protein